MSERRKVGAVLRDFRQEIDQLRRLDDQNQLRFYPGPGRPSRGRLTKRQMHMLSEAIFARGFSRLEEVLEQIFILYCQGKPSGSGHSVGSYLLPKNANHTRALLKSGMPFLDWNSPDTVLERCETYLHRDSPIHLAISSNKTRLTRMRKIRNAVAHTSLEAQLQFSKVVRDELGVAPLRAPTVGEFLIMTDRAAPLPQYFLRSYLDVMDKVAVGSAG